MTTVSTIANTQLFDSCPGQPISVYKPRNRKACLGSSAARVATSMFPYALAPLAHTQAAGIERYLIRAIRSLAHRLEAKDAYTWGHSRRVSAYALSIAREMGLTEAEQATLALGGELHDVGKIGVRGDVLRKPGPLTEDEYRHVMEHTIIGARILGPLLPADSAVIGIVRWHHERIDGYSLPDGLSGDSIPLEARIVAVADAFDAMTSERPYRRALSTRRALRELEEHSGTQFDEDCVQACATALYDWPALLTTRATRRSTDGDSGTRRRC